MNLTWNQPPTIDGQYCQYWISQEAVIIEAREPMCGPNKNAELLRELCEELLRDPLARAARRLAPRS